MKMIFTDDEREQILNVYSQMAQDPERKMYEQEAKVLGEVIERVSGYRGKEKFDEVHLTSIGFILQQIVEANLDPDEESKPLLELYKTIMEKLASKLKK